MVIQRNEYYAQPGKADEVLTTRKRACDVREMLALSRGTVLQRLRGSDDQPDVVWEAIYPDLAAYERAQKIMDDSPEFEAVRQQMAPLIRRFERSVWEVRDPL